MIRTYLHREWSWRLFATMLCFLFGVAFILNIHPIGDGLWFWYAVLLRSGHKLYADMHLPLQPLFVLLTEYTQVLLGKSWLASKMLAGAQLVAFCLALFLITGFTAWKDWQRAILIPAVFGLTLASFYSRFDDYHITGYCFEAWSIYLLLRCTEQNELPTAAILGLLAGLDIGNRLNDGAALFAAIVLVLPFFAIRRRLLALAIFCSTAPLTLLAVIALTGDSVRDWATNSIIRAAAIKGGTGNVLASPFAYPLSVAREMGQNVDITHCLTYIFFVVLVVVLLQKYGRNADGRWSIWKIALGVLAIAAFTFRVHRYFRLGVPLEEITYSILPVALLLSLCLAVLWIRMLFNSAGRFSNPRTLLLLIPLIQIPGTTLSSRGAYLLEVYPQAAMLLLLLPISLSSWLQGASRKTAYLTLAAMIAISAAYTKTTHPYYWHHFVDLGLFEKREWYNHPVYAGMYIDADQLSLMQAMCKKIDQDGPPTELLSIPVPYPNYFCNVSPWHGYVQTWYDTVSQQTIDTLIGELETAPPKWIIYQRAPDSMAAHEKVFTAGQPLPHRALDKLIVDRVDQGKWIIVGCQSFRGADWFVIQTHT